MNRIKTLDGLRGIAILLVLAGHVAQNYRGLDPTIRLWSMAFANSSAGVRLFFVLSGYLITGILLREYADTNSISLSQFYWRRILRIFPAFYSFLLAALLLGELRGDAVPTGSWLAAASFTWNYRFLWPQVQQDVWVLGHLWTLALEQQFYLLWPLLLAALEPRRALWVAGALIIWCPLARVVTHLLFPTLRGFTGVMLHTAVDSIMAGCATALVAFSANARQWISSRSKAWHFLALLWLFLGSPMAATLVRGFPTTIGFTIDALAAGWVIVALHYGAKTTLHSLFARGPLPALGVISYSLYLWQQIFITPDSYTTPVAVVWRVVGACATAILSYLFIEKPFLRLKNIPMPWRVRPLSREQ